MANDKGTTDFTKPATSYQEAIEAAKAKAAPVGGTPMPKMPRFDQAQPSTRTTGVQSVRAAQRILTPEQQSQLQNDGKFIPGVGSGYAANQPGLAQPTSPEGEVLPVNERLAPRPPGSGLRQDTVEGLKALAKANSGNAQESTENDEELNKINKEISEIDEVWETNEFGERVRSLLRNKKRKEAIEARCPTMDFEDLLMSGSVMQKVPIIPGRFEPTFRSLQGTEDLEIKRLMGSIRGPDQYILDTFSIFNLTAGLHAINGKILPSHLDKNGDFDEKLFEAKNKTVIKMAIPILADLSVNFTWFVNRVQKLTVIDEIKGF